MIGPRTIFWRLREHTHTSPDERDWDARAAAQHEGPAVGGAYRCGETLGSSVVSALSHSYSVNLYVCEKCKLGYMRSA